MHCHCSTTPQPKLFRGGVRPYIQTSWCHVGTSPPFRPGPKPNQTQLNSTQTLTKSKPQPNPNLNQFQTSTKSKPQPNPTKLNCCLGQPNQTKQNLTWRREKVIELKLFYLACTVFELQYISVQGSSISYVTFRSQIQIIYLSRYSSSVKGVI